MSLRLLLVEDNPGDAVIFQEKLGASGLAYTLAHARRLDEGLRALAREGFDLLFVDLSLPDALGVEAVARVRAAAPDVPLLVLTGLDDATVAAEAKRTGATDYLVKWTMDSPALARHVRYAVEQGRLAREAGPPARVVASAPLEAPSAARPTRARPTPATVPEAFDLGAALEAALAHVEGAALQAQRLARLLRAALDLRRREREGAAPTPAPLDLLDAARRAARRQGEASLGRGVVLAVQSPHQQVAGRADPHLLDAALDRLFAEVTASARADSPALSVDVEGRAAVLRATWEAVPGRAPSGDGADAVAALGMALADRLAGLAGGALTFACTRDRRCEATLSLPASGG